MSLLYIIGMTGFNASCSSAFLILRQDCEDEYVCAIEGLLDLCAGHLVEVIMIDRKSFEDCH